MLDHELTLYAVNCSSCGQPTVTSVICTRPDLCYPCFVATISSEGGEPGA
jgi:hypothetical protein